MDGVYVSDKSSSVELGRGGDISADRVCQLYEEKLDRTALEKHSTKDIHAPSNHLVFSLSALWVSNGKLGCFQRP